MAATAWFVGGTPCVSFLPARLRDGCVVALGCDESCERGRCVDEAMWRCWLNEGSALEKKKSFATSQTEFEDARRVMSSGCPWWQCHQGGSSPQRWTYGEWS